MSQNFEIVQLKIRAWVNVYDRTVRLLKTLVKTGGLVLCVRYVYLSLGVLAGKETKLDAVVRTIVHFGADRWVAYSIGAIFGVSWVRQRKLFRDSIEARGKYIKELEIRIDPNRSSSGLSDRGRPAPLGSNPEEPDDDE